ncbi:helix-turn-helix domain-containing protein [Erysipelothrix anatis]|uniref:helix-turn-helix domain-containing protein n=1 Tax=Erysipelothrix anatis TaxID=2683713 RepID=UPI00135ABD91|nr:helix-turn-helix transcriptional regulator [Erysipelothrix anatis]
MNFDELLQKYGFTRYKLSKQTGLQQSSLAKYSNGVSDPLNMPLKNAKKIADQFEITLDDFYDLLT